MKAIAILTLALGAHWFQSEKQTDPPPTPRYVLVTQSWDSVVSSYGGVGVWEHKWMRDYREFDSRDDAIEFLRDRTSLAYGTHSNGRRSKDWFVGLWRLDDSNRVDVKHDVVTHKKEVRVEVKEEAWDEHKWSVGP